MRVGLIADTHMPGTIDALWPQVMQAFDGVDLILHAGDLHTLHVVDELESLAPVHVARGNGDVGIVDARLEDVWQLELDGISVGMIHKMPSPERKSPEQIQRYVSRHFAEQPRVVVYGHTHLESLHNESHCLYVNPGSPTLPRNQSLRLGTIGFLEIEDAGVTASIWQLNEADTAPTLVASASAV